MDIIIERAKRADAMEVLQYLKAIGGETDNLSFGSEGLPFTQESEAEYLGQIEKSCDEIMLLAKKDGKIIGSATLSRLPRRMKHRGELSVSVLREYWNQGIGSWLLDEIIRFAQDYSFDVIDLQVRSDNASAVHLYQKFGFIKIGTHPHFFKIENEQIPFDYMCLTIR